MSPFKETEIIDLNFFERRQVWRMKTMYDVAEILKYYNENGSIREVQRRTRISKNTIAKYLARVEENKKDQSLEIIRSKQIIILLIYT
jgi:hypothetical protein